MTNSTNKAVGALEGGTFELYAVGDAVNGVTIISEGISGDISRTLQLDLTPMSASEVFNKAIYSYGDLNISNMEVDGDVASNGRVKHPRDFAHQVIERHYEEHPKPIIPFLPPDPENGVSFNVGNNETRTLTGNYSYTNISIDNRGTLVFKPSGGIMQVVIDTLETKGNVIVEAPPGGRVELFITNKADFKTPRTVNSGNPADLFIYLADDARMDMQANVSVNGYIYGPGAKVGFQANHTRVTGAIIAELVVMSYNATAPPVNGNVIFSPVPADVGGLTGVISLRRTEWRG